MGDLQSTVCCARSETDKTQFVNLEAPLASRADPALAEESMLAALDCCSSDEAGRERGRAHLINVESPWQKEAEDREELIMCEVWCDNDEISRERGRAQVLEAPTEDEAEPALEVVDPEVERDPILDMMAIGPPKVEPVSLDIPGSPADKTNDSYYVDSQTAKVHMESDLQKKAWTHPSLK
mmetsp:Transcript_69076/g.123018  ORF Transcript_69076/g.123018 Transcript_69076/m.123018 type:complete len:181 (-) Transcript_69076:329-871(-)